MNAIAYVHEQLTGKKEFPAFKAGDNVTVNYKIIEGNKERIQSFKGDVIKKQGNGATASFTVRKISDGVGVERLFPFFSPNIDSIELNKTYYSLVFINYYSFIFKYLLSLISNFHDYDTTYIIRDAWH